MGIYGATIGVAVAVGPLVGGALTDGLGWQSIFYLNVPVGVAAIAVTYAKLRESRDPNASRVDWAGVATFSGALFLLVLALLRGNDEGWGSGPIVSLLAGSAVLLAAFVAVELRVGEPMLPLGLFTSAVVHRRPARRVRGVELNVRAVPLPDAVPAELPRLLAARGGAALPAVHAAGVPARPGRGRCCSRASPRAC